MSFFFPDREQFLELVRLLGECAEPYSVTAAMLVDQLAMVEELRQEMDAFLNDVLQLAELQEVMLPEATIAELQQDLFEMGRVRECLDLPVVFSAQTRERCGNHAVPVLALLLFQLWNWVEYGATWLESVDRLRIQVDALLGVESHVNSPGNSHA